MSLLFYVDFTRFHAAVCCVGGHPSYARGGGVDCPVVDAVCGPATLYLMLRISTISHGILTQGG